MSDGILRLAEKHPDKPREACGVVGIWGKDQDVQVVHLCYLGLYACSTGDKKAGSHLRRRK